ncbi:16S rRNA (adenine(1518)-N(6)/adenine(1519)-N(6))-dimethyltransferase RsmA [Buchnera aphidicola (Ceratovacuna keduensis)]|uniref:16S rRNA (adenine(1518)-N(6)/adenine(1519)-N(6))- dimethyltransferase RsmA n=1 Tax=Buchnera aphidicola TaxID=9 RepID=UPI0031B7F713
MNIYLKKKIKLKKSLGQNFLVDMKIIEKILKYICPKKNNNFFEIGAGSGSLTKVLYIYVKKLLVIEIDNYLFKFLKNYFFKKNVNIFNEDILKFNFKKKLKNYFPIRIIGNLPYNISINIIFYCIKFLKKIEDIHFMLQYEVAKKISAKVGSKFYGKLSIFLQYYFKIKILFKIGPKSFYPSPKVNSCFVKLFPTNKFFDDEINMKHFKYIVSTAFSKRRKILKNSLSKIFNKNIFFKLNINSSLRAQNITIIEYCKLTKYFSKNIFKNFMY